MYKHSKLTPNAMKVLEKRYLSKNENGDLAEDADGMFLRVARAVASADKRYTSAEEAKKTERKFYEMMVDTDFLPNSPTLMNAGRQLGQLSACFVLPIKDSMEDIFRTLMHAALIHKSGGGTGFSFSNLRAKGSQVNSTSGAASGPISFLEVYNAATEAVKQGGTRRGANMGILKVDHPDIMEFITCKRDSSKITNFNISVGMTEEFMLAVEQDGYYDLVDPHTKQLVCKQSAKEVFDLIVEMAWLNGEPGIIFLDRLNKDNVTPELGAIESTNPCGEQPLLPYESCNLGSINLGRMVKYIKGKYEVDYDKLRQVVENAVHFLDNVIEVNKYPLPEISEMTKGTRKIGLGVMGWADLLCKLEIPYNSEDALSLAEDVMGFIQKWSRDKSIDLAKQRGVFSYYNKSIYKDTGIEVRNSTTTTIAPTGTLSIIAASSSGIEPLFAVSYIRNVMDDDELLEVNPLFKEIAIKEGFYSEKLMREIAKSGTIANFSEIPQRIRKVFVTSHDISPSYHIRMQAAFQKYTDNAVSKTVNLPHEATRDDVREVFMMAYKTGCKGVTIYRDGSRNCQVLNIDTVKGKESSSCIANLEDVEEYDALTPRTRPSITTGFTEKVKIGCGNLYVTVNYDDKGICEVFTNTGRAGGCPSQSEATSRLVSIALRSGIDAQSIVGQLKGIRCPSTIRQKGLKVMSCPDAIGRLIEKVMKIQDAKECEKKEAISYASVVLQASAGDSVETVGLFRTTADVCPECNAQVEHEGGCVVCRNCGYSKCG